MSDLVERLRAIDEEAMYQAPATTHATVNEAADTIEALTAKNNRLRDALEPFSKAGSLFDNEPADPRWTVLIYRPAAGDEYNITDRHLRAARAALNGEPS